MKKLPILLVAAATLLGLGLRMADLGRLGLGTDEGHSAWLAAQPLSELPELLSKDSAPPLYYAMLHVWQAAFPSDEGIRGLSVLLGTASIPLTFLIARLLLGTWCGVASTFFMAAAAFHGMFSQIAKNNALLLFVAQLALLFLLMAIRAPSRTRAWAGYALGVAALLYTHAVAPFVIAALGAVFLLLAGERLKAGLKPWILAHVAAGLLFLPWAGIAFHQAGEVSQAFWASKPSLSMPVRTFLSFILYRPPAPAEALEILGGPAAALAAAPGAGALLRALPRIAWWIPVILASAGGAAVLVAARRPRELLALAALFAVPVGGIWLISQVITSIYLDRVLLPVMTPLAILPAVPFAFAGREAARRGDAPPRWLTAAGMAISALLLPMMLFASFYLTQVRRGAEWREAARWVAERAEPGDAVVYDAHFGQIIFERYLGGAAAGLEAYGLPSGWYADGTPTVGRWVRGEGDLEPLREAAAKHRVVWLVRAHTAIHDPDELARAWCMTHLRETESRRFLAIEVTRYAAASAPAKDSEIGE